VDQPDTILQNNLLTLTNHRCLPQAHHTPHDVQENSEEKETMTPDLIPPLPSPVTLGGQLFPCDICEGNMGGW